MPAMRVAAICASAMLLLSAASRGAAAAEDLERGFAQPPNSAKPWAYWWWLDSNASKEGITRDLEEMRRQGIGGVLVTGAVKASDNALEIDVVNLWPNRLIGDAKLPVEKRLTKTNVQKFYRGQPTLMESGLLGPVRFLAASEPRN